MNILQLRYFTTVAQLENVSRAADLLFISQSALSKNIAKLEEELGTPLFTRNGKKLTLNDQGMRFLECSNRILRELDNTLEEISQISKRNDSRIRICVTGVSRQLMDCMSDFRKIYPKIEFSISTRMEEMEVPDINEFDILVYPAGGRYNKYSGYPFYSERYYLAVNENHPLAKKESVTLQDMVDEDIVFLRGVNNTYEYPYTVCSTLSIPFRSQCFVDNRVLQRQILVGGLAVSFLTEGECSYYRHESPICVLPIQDLRFSRQIMICFRRDKHLSESARLFRDYLLDYFHLEQRTLETDSPFGFEPKRS